ncbi:hypothetical protein GGI26_000752 [Coemansia sp. RSA 1358]|uniref:RAD51 interacting motif domain-containing protein n=1 Tax=Coemansia umbellata TaxID=1424467 RepID=A0ABQ8PQT8_9FUNG|nr:hypothetical protein EDC05_002102 [Coemansia umbellata]KAJ2625282.1 hypothetical protein GGI26_000752 [Coemansia sp. RSA 1358]
MTRSSTRAHKKVNYFEEASKDSEESTFELSDEEEKPRKKAKLAKSANANPRPSSNVSSKSSRVAKRSSAQADSSSGSSNGVQSPKGEREPGSDAIEREQTPIIGSSQSDGGERDASDLSDLSSIASKSDNERSAPSSRTASIRKASVKDDDDEMSDGFDPQSSASDFDDDDDGADFVIDIVSNKSKRANGKSIAKSSPKATKTKARGRPAAATEKAVKAPIHSTKKTPSKAAGKPLSLGTQQGTRPVISAAPAKRNAQLGSLLSSPKSAKPAKPSLQSAGSSRSSLSSTSLSLSPSNAQKRKSMLSTKAGTSLKDILGSANSAPRAGLRRVPKKVA